MKKNIKTPTHIVGRRRHGFRRRMRTASGRRVLRLRRQKGRYRIAI